MCMRARVTFQGTESEGRVSHGAKKTAQEEELEMQKSSPWYNRPSPRMLAIFISTRTIGMFHSTHIFFNIDRVRAVF